MPRLGSTGSSADKKTQNRRRRSPSLTQKAKPAKAMKTAKSAKPAAKGSRSQAFGQEACGEEIDYHKKAKKKR